MRGLPDSISATGLPSTDEQNGLVWVTRTQAAGEPANNSTVDCCDGDPQRVQPCFGVEKGEGVWSRYLSLLPHLPSPSPSSPPPGLGPGFASPCATLPLPLYLSSTVADGSPALYFIAASRNRT